MDKIIIPKIMLPLTREQELKACRKFIKDGGYNYWIKIKLKLIK